MLRLSRSEFVACIRSLSQLRISAVKPIGVCHKCHYHISSSKQFAGCFLGNQYFLGLLAPEVQSSQWSSAGPLCQYFSTSSDKTERPGPEESKSDGTKKKVAKPPSPIIPPPASASSQAVTNKAAETGDQKAAEGDSGDSKAKNKVLRITPRQRKPTPLDYSYTGNIYILPQRALLEYLLKPSDIEELPKYTRRSPYADGTRITLYLRTDVEEVALKKWGSYDVLNKEKAKLRGSEGQGAFDPSDWRSIIGEINAPGYTNPDDPAAHFAGSKPDVNPHEPTFLASGSTKVVMSAIVVNAANSLFKLIAWLYTGSHSMFSEFIHSCADTMNQVILGIGLYHSFKKPDTDHPYGYRNLRHISSLISGVGIFFLGTGLSWYHCIIGILQPTELVSLHWCIATLVGSFFSEGATLVIAINQVRKSCKTVNMTFVEYLLRGVDPNVNVVLLEDLAAVLGVGVAGTCIAISHFTGSPYADAFGSAIIGTLLGGVAGFIVYNNVNQLVGRSIPLDERQDISGLLEKDRMIRSLHDIKATQMGGLVRYKAEVDFDGREITRAYLYKQDLELLLKQAQSLQTVDELEDFMLEHGEKVIDTLGAEVDRIEKALKSRHPEIRHVDLEAL